MRLAHGPSLQARRVTSGLQEGRAANLRPRSSAGQAFGPGRWKPLRTHGAELWPCGWHVRLTQRTPWRRPGGADGSHSYPSDMRPSVTVELGGNSPSGNIFPIIIYFNRGENNQVTTNAYLYPRDGGIRIKSNDQTSNGPIRRGGRLWARGVAVQGDVVWTGRAAAPPSAWAAAKAQSRCLRHGVGFAGSSAGPRTCRAPAREP